VPALSNRHKTTLSAMSEATARLVRSPKWSRQTETASPAKTPSRDDPSLALFGTALDGVRLTHGVRRAHGTLPCPSGSDRGGGSYLPLLPSASVDRRGSQCLPVWSPRRAARDRRRPAPAPHPTAASRVSGEKGFASTVSWRSLSTISCRVSGRPANLDGRRHLEPSVHRGEGSRPTPVSRMTYLSCGLLGGSPGRPR